MKTIMSTKFIATWGLVAFIIGSSIAFTLLVLQRPPKPLAIEPAAAASSVEAPIEEPADGMAVYRTWLQLDDRVYVRKELYVVDADRVAAKDFFLKILGSDVVNDKNGKPIIASIGTGWKVRVTSANGLDRWLIITKIGTTRNLDFMGGS